MFTSFYDVVHVGNNCYELRYYFAPNEWDVHEVYLNVPEYKQETELPF
jgi:hypothetical protein